METITAFLALCFGLFVRLAVPILTTALAVYFLKRLDERWQTESGFQSLPVEKPKCWKIRECPHSTRVACPGYLSPLPCWQVFRLPNGYLREECLTCKVFLNVPIPVHA